MSSSTFEQSTLELITLFLIPHTTMSEDPTRQPASPEKAFTGDQWKGAERTHSVKPENANVYAAAASQHTAGGSAADVTITDAVQSIKIEDFAALPKKPCVRDSLLTGITAGFVVGSSRAIWRGMWIEAFSLV
jgi:cytochrome c oxidase assembly protein subunit 20